MLNLFSPLQKFLALLAILAVSVNGQMNGNGKTTRYWDCCKTSCAWDGKADVTQPIATCAANGVDVLGTGVTSGCNGGSAFVCNNQQPFVIGDTAYGWVAASISGKTERDTCCACLEFTFTSGPVQGKKMIVQVSNTGSDLGENHFDIQIPGGGLGIFNGCTPQWGAPSDGWGNRYGGVSSVGECNQLPQQLQEGCRWRFGWFQNADNPNVSFREVACPAELTSRSRCSRR
jgi:hypothetical protein